MTELDDIWQNPPAMQITPEHAALIARYEASLAAGHSGEPMPEGGDEMAYKSGIAKRRVEAGEIIGFVCQSSRCKACGEQNWGYRLGCACWPMDGRTLFTKESGYSMEYGAQVDAGSDPEAPESTFMVYARIVELAKAGREVIDVLRGEPVPIDLTPSSPPLIKEEE